MIPCHVGFNDCWHECSNLETVPFGTRCVPDSVRHQALQQVPRIQREIAETHLGLEGSWVVWPALISPGLSPPVSLVLVHPTARCGVWHTAGRRADTSLADPSLSVLSCRCAGGTLAGAWRRRNAHRRGGTSGVSWTNLYLLVMGRLSRN